MKENIKVKCIVASTMAKYLLKQGFNIIDIKPLRDDPKRSVFVFDDSRGTIGEAMKNYNLEKPLYNGSV